ncbi:MAG: acetyltransferase, partial [Limnobacter sp.]
MNSPQNYQPWIPKVPLSKILPAPVVGVLTVTMMSLCITFWFIVMFPFIVLRLVPVYRVQRVASNCCVQIATWWVGSDKQLYKLLHGQQGQVEIHGEFKPHSSYLVISNHTAWADIVVLFDVLHGHAPFGRFFLKKELIWVPIVGVVCWAMDFPFMKRHSRAAIARNPALASQDLETTRKACAVYKESPVTVINFLEGTRFTPAKKAKTKSPYTHLLGPKYGGLSASLNAMGEQFAGMVNVTIAYGPSKGNITWSWLCGKQ